MTDKTDFGSRFDLNKSYIDCLTEQDKEMYEVIRPLRKSSYSIDVHISSIENKIESLTEEAKSMGGEIKLNPDFQHGHVCKQEKKISFIENFFSDENNKYSELDIFFYP